MITLNRLMTIGLGSGLVAMGCASPVDDETADTSAALTTEEAVAAPTEETNAALTEESQAGLTPGMISAFEIPGAAPGLAPPSDEDATDDVAQGDEKWGWGWGGFGMPGFGWGRSLGWGWGGFGGWGVPGGFGWGVAPGWGWGGWW